MADVVAVAQKSPPVDPQVTRTLTSIKGEIDTLNAKVTQVNQTTDAALVEWRTFTKNQKLQDFLRDWQPTNPNAPRQMPQNQPSPGPIPAPQPGDGRIQQMPFNPTR
jgi:hypothetical protein